MRDDPDLEFHSNLDTTFDRTSNDADDVDTEEEVDPNSSELESTIEKIKADLNPSSGGPIRTEPERGELEINTRSKLNQSTSIQVLTRLKRILNRYDCILKDYYIKFHNEGFDITKIRIIPHDVDDLMSKVDKAQLIRFRDKPAALAMIIIADELRQQCSDDLALKVKVYAYDGADIGSISVVNEDPNESMDEFAATAPDLEAMGDGMDFSSEEGDLDMSLGAPEGAELGADGQGLSDDQDALGAEEMPTEELPEGGDDAIDVKETDDAEIESAIQDLARGMKSKTEEK